MRYFIGFLITIGLIVLIFVLLLSGGHSGVTTPPLQLVTYANSNADAQLVIDGPISGEQTHREIQIDVNQTAATFTLYQGYQKTIISTQTFANNTGGFGVFLQGLQRANFTKGNDDKSLSDERGYCPTGERYIMTLSNNGHNVVRYWATTCGQGTFKGTLQNVLFLFRQQIPDYGTLTNDLSLN